MRKANIKGIPNKWFYLSVFLLSLYFIIRIIDQSKLMWIFPLDFANDYSGHMAMLHFLKEYGYGNFIPNWYGGGYLLNFYHPFSYFYALPFYYLFGNVQVTIFVTMIIIYILNFVIIFYLLGRNENLSKIKRIALFLFFFASPWGIGYFLRVGKYAEFLGFFWFILLFIIILWYKDHKIDYLWFLFFIPVYSLLLITHISVFFISSFLVLALFIVKTNREKVYIFLSGIISLILTFWWWFPFMENMNGRVYEGFYGLQRTLTMTGASLNDNISAFIIPVAFIIIFYLYWKTNLKSKKELVFYSIPLIINLLILTRIAIFIPYINRPIVDTYNLIFLFLTVYLFLKINFSHLTNKLKKIFFVLLIFVPVFFVFVSFIFTPFFIENSYRDKEIIGLFPYMEGKTLIIGNSESYGKALYSYGAIYYNMSSPVGWTKDSIPISYVEKLREINRSFGEKECEGFINALRNVDTINIITFDNNCQFLANCSFKLIKSIGNSCLYSI